MGTTTELLTAEKARALSLVGSQEELKEILSKIEDTAKSGSNSFYYYGYLNMGTIKSLKDLGYSVAVGSSPDYKISW